MAVKSISKMAQESLGRIKRKIGAVFGTGPAGNGKTTHLELLEGLLSPRKKPFSKPCGKIARVDMSQILIKWGMAQNHILGEELRKCIPMIEKGEYVPDELTIPTFIMWLEEIERHADVETLLIGGAPRTLAQLQFLDMFSSALIVHKTATRQQSDAAITKRWRESQQRKSSNVNSPGEIRLESVISPEYLQQRWDAYTGETIPMVASVNPEKMLDLDPNDSLLVRMEKTITRLEATSKITKSSIIDRAHRRLDDPKHPIRIRIEEIEGKATKVTRTSNTQVNTSLASHVRPPTTIPQMAMSQR